MKQRTALANVVPLLLFPVLISSSPAHATGFLRVDNSTFLKSASTRDLLVTTFSAGTDFEHEGDWVSGKVDALGIIFTHDQTSLTFEARDVHLATSWKLIPNNQISVGRRIYDWSQADTTWKMGQWNPRFLWDPLRHDIVGKTGAFYEFKSRLWRMRAFGSPVSIPERGVPTTAQDGRIVTSDPFSTPPYEKARVMNEEVPIRYSIDMPDTMALIARPQGAGQVRFGPEKGPWVSAAYGYGPIHQLDMPMDYFLNTQTLTIDVTLHPRMLFHHLATAEAGFKGDPGAVWISASREVPIAESVPADWNTAPMGSAWIGSAGSELVWGFRGKEDLKLNASVLYVQEDLANAAPAKIQMPLPSRFPYKKAWKLGAEVRPFEIVTAGVSMVSDLENPGELYSADVKVQPMKYWLMQVGADVIRSDVSKGWFGRFKEDHRVLWRVAYVF